MDPTLLHKRFKTLVDFGMATKRDATGPLITHSTRGDMDIWSVLAFEFNADAQHIRDILLPQIKEDRRNISYAWEKHPSLRVLERPHVTVMRVTTPDGEWGMYDSWRASSWGKASNSRMAAIGLFAQMGSLLWRPPFYVMAAERLGEFMLSDEEFLTISGIRFIKTWTENKTIWIAHEPHSYTRRYVQWPRPAGSWHDTPRLDITGLEDYFVVAVDRAASELYQAVYGVFLKAGGGASEQLSAERDLEMVISRGDLTFPGEPHVS